MSEVDLTKETAERLAHHIERHKAFELAIKEKDLSINTQQEKNTVAIAALTKSTQGLVDAWSAAQSFQRFIKWLSGFAILVALVSWFSAKLSHLPFFNH